MLVRRRTVRIAAFQAHNESWWGWRAQWGLPGRAAEGVFLCCKSRFREWASFVLFNAVLMCKRFLRSETVKTSWIRWNPVGTVETGPSPRSYLACEETHSAAFRGFVAFYKLLSATVGQDIHTFDCPDFHGNWFKEQMRCCVQNTDC